MPNKQTDQGEPSDPSDPSDQTQSRSLSVTLWPSLDPVLSGLLLVAVGFCVFIALSVSKSAHASNYYGGPGIVVDETGAPLAGVHVLTVIYSRGAINVPIPWRKGRIECGPEYATKSDAQGKYVIPDKEMEFSRGISLFENRRPWIRVVAYLPGYRMVDDGPPMMGIGQNDEGIYRIKDEAVSFKVVLKRHEGTAKQRAEQLVGLAAVGCACRSMHKALWNEYREVMPRAVREHNSSLGISWEDISSTRRDRSTPSGLVKPEVFGVDWYPSNSFQCNPTSTLRGNDGIERPLHTFID